jgi:plastocyanin
MKLRKSRIALAGAPLAALVALLVLVVVPGISAAAEMTEPAAEEGVTTIEIKMEGKKMGFFGPKTVHEGEELRIVNNTMPSMVGPHTFSLVTKGSLPKTAKLRKECFTPGKICMGIAKWYGLKGEEEPKNPLVKAGQEGWDTMGTTTKKGDSYFFAKKGESFEQVVSAKAGTTLYFMCAVHAFMQGSIKVLPPVSTP